jgi:hypothetical protein
MLINLFMMLLLSFLPVRGYLDTTPRNFAKPEPLVVKPYSYVRPQHELYVEEATEKIAPRVFGSVLGPAGLLINVAGKAIEAQEKQDASNSQSLNSK